MHAYNDIASHMFPQPRPQDSKTTLSQPHRCKCQLCLALVKPVHEDRSTAPAGVSQHLSEGAYDVPDTIMVS
jgi:hypothetical protein